MYSFVSLLCLNKVLEVTTEIEAVLFNCLLLHLIYSFCRCNVILITLHKNNFCPAITYNNYLCGKIKPVFKHLLFSLGKHEEYMNATSLLFFFLFLGRGRLRGGGISFFPICIPLWSKNPKLLDKREE